MDISQNEVANLGISYENINWYNIEGQPFGSSNAFNGIIFNDANNIIHVQGAMAIGGKFISSRGFTVGFGKESHETVRNYLPNTVKMMVAGDISTNGPLVALGHVVSGGNVRINSGSTYLIGKEGTPTQMQELDYLYKAEGGSPYWAPSDQGNHYLISSYDTSRYIPASRIRANLPMYFQNARNGILENKRCVDQLKPNGRVVDNFHEWVLRGNDPRQNVFLINVSPNGILNKGIRAEVPEGSLIIVKIRTGINAHLQYGLLGEEEKANRTLYVFEDATQIYMEVAASIWGSFLAPQAMFHGHSTGGHISGNVAFNSFAVGNRSGFEFHHYPFIGGLVCGAVSHTPAPRPIPAPIPAPVPAPAPIPVPAPVPAPCPECPECPPLPLPKPCPECPPLPLPKPCPECPPLPLPKPCPECPPLPLPKPCPECPPIPSPKPCPECVPTPLPIPMPIPIPIARQCPECQIVSGVIAGYIKGCYCCKSHVWDVKLYRIDDECKELMDCIKVDCYGDIQFEVPYEGNYVLTVCPFAQNRRFNSCKPIVVLTNIGVENFVLEN